MKSKTYAIRSLCCLLLLGGVSLAQKEKRIRADWLTNDVANIERLLPQLTGQEPLTIAALESIFGSETKYERLGFGGRTFNFSKSGGYAYLRVSGLVVNDTIASYTISLESSSSWPKVKSVLIESWKRSGGLEFSEGKYGIAHDREFPNVVADYKKAVGAQLGELKPVTVPPRLSKEYELLISLGNNSMIGDVCGLGGTTPGGKTAIDELARTGRVDLLSNILKGYNPGGRVYAGLALLAMHRKGTELTPDVRHALEVIRTLDIELWTCSGCIVTIKTAQQILDRNE